jgi:Golgi nucleoside diphosphatase
MAYPVKLPRIPPRRNPQLSSVGRANPNSLGLKSSESSGGAMRYAVVLDAGSTGSRVHSYRFKSSGVGALNLVDDTFEQLKPGLSSFAEVPSHPRINLATLYNTSSPTALHLRDLDAAEPSGGALPVSAAVWRVSVHRRLTTRRSKATQA